MPLTPSGPARTLRSIVRLVAEALVLFYLALDAIFTPLFRPLARWAAGLRIMERLQALVAGLPPYGVLAALAVPFALAEPAKVYALVLFAGGRWLAGALVLTGAYLVSLLIVERIYAAGRDGLRTIAWFAALMDWLVAYRDRVLAFARSTAAYAAAIRLRRRAAATLRRLRLQLGFR